jgi:glycogen(starch) synthase
MRVLSVGNLYPPHHFGGYEQVWASAVAHLRALDDTVRVLATDYRHPGAADGDEPDVHRELRWYWRDHDFEVVPFHQRLPLERHNQRVLRRHLEELRPELVCFWSMGGMSHSLIEQVREREIPVVCFVHDGWLEYGPGFDQWTRMFHARWSRWAGPLVAAATGIPTRVHYGRAGRYVFVSRFIAERAAELGLGLDDTAVAPSGIGPGFAPAPEPSRWEGRLLHVGRLHPDKGIEDAVRALAALGEPATLTFAGSWDPREEAALDELVAGLGLAGQVRMLGQQPPERVAELYRTADALLFPVRWEEPWGLVPLEAMASGCPVIATARGGSAEYLRDGENALVVAPRAPEQLAAAVARLRGDPSLRARLRRAGIATAAQHTEAIFNREVARHIHEVGGRRPAAATRTDRPRSAPIQRRDGAPA